MHIVILPDNMSHARVPEYLRTSHKSRLIAVQCGSQVPAIVYKWTPHSMHNNWRVIACAEHLSLYQSQTL